jgi:uncharacterized protein YcbK (DUF882 family)
VRPRLAGPLVLASIALLVLLAARSGREIRRSAEAAVAGPPAPAHPDLFLPPMLEAAAEPDTPHRSFARLPAVNVLNYNNLEHAPVRLYDFRGRVDPDATRLLERLLCDVTKPDEVRCAPIDPRVLQLLFRAAYHFGRGEIVIISGYRDPGKQSEGLHALGRAVDFRLTGVPLLRLAAYLRELPRVGVGVYTHPKTQYVHLDTRERSYHWGDSSGPGARGAEWPLGGDGALVRRDAAYARASDWPEGTVPPLESW